MNSNESRTLWISVGVALFAIFLLYSWSQQQREEVQRKFGSAERIVFAAKDIAEMQTIDESMLSVREVPTEFRQPGVIKDASLAVGQVAATPIKKDEQILQNKLLLPGPETGLSLEVSPGKRAITVPVDDTRGVSRLIKPGDRIDLVAALDFGKGADARREVRTVMQDLTVLATGLNMVNKIPRRLELDSNGQSVLLNNLSGNTNFNSITVEVRPEEVQRLVYILSVSPGNLFVTLRHPSDRSIGQLPSTTIESVLNKADVLRVPASIGAPVAPPEPQTAPRQMPPKRRGGGFEDL